MGLGYRVPAGRATPFCPLPFPVSLPPDIQLFHHAVQGFVAQDTTAVLLGLGIGIGIGIARKVPHIYPPHALLWKCDPLRPDQ